MQKYKGLVILAQLLSQIPPQLWSVIHFNDTMKCHFNPRAMYEVSQSCYYAVPLLSFSLCPMLLCRPIPLGVDDTRPSGCLLPEEHLFWKTGLLVLLLSYNIYFSHLVACLTCLIISFEKYSFFIFIRSHSLIFSLLSNLRNLPLFQSCKSFILHFFLFSWV